MKEVTAHHVGVHSNIKIRQYKQNDNEIPTAYLVDGILFKDNQYCGELIRKSNNKEIDYGMAILFQNGNPSEVGFNGLTNEALLAIIRDRLISFQSSEFASVENQQALVHVDEALESLKRRTRDRITRKVEGTHIV